MLVMEKSVVGGLGYFEWRRSVLCCVGYFHEEEGRGRWGQAVIF